MTVNERFELHIASADHPSGKWLSVETIKFVLPSGRIVRYQMSNYPFHVDSTEAEIDALASRVIRDKYRECEWDRDHPESDSKVEIFDALKRSILKTIALARKAQAEKDGTEKA
jgi:hypothetical protein